LAAIDDSGERNALGPVAGQHEQCGELLSACVVSEAQQRCGMLVRERRTWRQSGVGLGAGCERRSASGACLDSCWRAWALQRTACVWREPEERLARAGRGRKCFAGCWGVGDAYACVRDVSAGLLRLCCAHAADLGAASAPAGRAESKARSAAAGGACAALTRTTPRQISLKVSPAKHVSGEQQQLRARRKLRARAIPCCRQAFSSRPWGRRGFALSALLLLGWVSV
jgi:hypothetical protein